MIRRVSVEGELALDMGRPAKRCAVCGEVGRPMVKVKDELICLECVKRIRPDPTRDDDEPADA